MRPDTRRRPGRTPAPTTPESTPRPTRTLRQLLTPLQAARLHDRYLSALWRGDDVDAVTAWLATQWQGVGPPEPRRAPEAVSLVGGAGCRTGIRWYRIGEAICGYLPVSHGGCFCIPVTAHPPALSALGPGE